MRAAGFHGEVPAANERAVGKLTYFSFSSMLTMTFFFPLACLFVRVFGGRGGKKEEEEEEEEVKEGEREEEEVEEV